MSKKVAQRPDWLNASQVFDIYSLSGCTSCYFFDYIRYWKYNGYWLFDSPTIIKEIVAELKLDVSGTTLFYYEVFEQEFDEESGEWSAFGPERSFSTHVEAPASTKLEGYDVVSFSAGSNPECSPLSCNHLAETLPTNQHCLFESFGEAKHSLEAGKFKECEPGPFRIFAVYTV